jgi:hypothetical protein
MNKIVVVAGVLACVSCGGNSFTGTVAGHSFVPAEAVFYSATGNGSVATIVVVSSTKGLCDDLASRTMRKNATYLELLMLGPGTADATGTYTVTDTLTGNSNSTRVGFVTLEAVDATCRSALTFDAGVAKAGTISVGRVDTNAANGSFDVTFGTDHATGSFAAVSCPAVATTAGDPNTRCE